MSSQFNVTKGYGFKVKGVISYNFKNFIRKHKSTLSKIQSNENIVRAITGAQDMRDIAFQLRFFSDDCSRYEGWPALISYIMTQETGISFVYECGSDIDNAGPVIIFEMCMPWNYTEKEKAITFAEIDEIVKKYADELHIKDSDIDYWNVGYFD